MPLHLAPSAFRRVSRDEVQWTASALDQRRHELLERNDPLIGRGPRVRRRRGECSVKHLRELLGKIGKCRCSRRLIQPDVTILRVDITVFRDVLVKLGNVTMPYGANEWVTAHQKKLKEYDGETKRIVVLRAHNAREGASLQLRRSVLGNADPAYELRTRFRKLKAVSVNERGGSPAGDQDTRVIDIPDDTAKVMNRAVSR